MRIPGAIAAPLRALLSGAPAPAWPRDEALLARGAEALAWHGALGLLDAEARRRDLALPDGLAAPARSEARRTAASNLWRLREAGALAEELAAAGARPLVLKGAWLAATAYDGPGERPMGDIDFLLPGGVDAAAEARLRARGYAPRMEGPEGTGHHELYVGPGPGGMASSVELHARLLRSPPYDRCLPPESLWARRRSALVGGSSAAGLDPADLLLHLAAHLAVQHAREERLIWVADLERVLRRARAEEPGFDARLAAAAAREGLEAPLAASLRALRVWFGTELGALEAVAPSAAERAAYDRLRARADVGREGARLWTDLRGARSWRDRVRLARAALLPPPAAMRRWHGVDRPWKLPIYYAGRLLRGAGQVGAHALRPRSQREAAGQPPERWMVEDS